MGSSFSARETNYIMKECLRKENIMVIVGLIMFLASLFVLYKFAEMGFKLEMMDKEKQRRDERPIHKGPLDDMKLSKKD